MTLSRLVAAAVASCVIGPAFAGPPEDAAHFEKKVRPILVEKCTPCHGPEKQKGDLRLDSRAALLAGGERGPAIVPTKPAESLLLHALAHDGELKMPPKNKLTDAEIAAVREWVKQGAVWPDAAAVVAAPPVKGGERPLTAEEKAFWAFQPVRRPAVPNQPDAGGNPVDAFLLDKLKANGLAFAKPTDKRTLIRRVTFDLTGLPPTPAEVDAYVRDESPDAYGELVDRLLASSAYGEKWGRRWLDVVRYADSNGMDENLAYVNAWRYRDWVIRSLNADKPFDRFVREQIAGDLIPGGTEAEKHDRLIATGMLVFGPKMIAEDDPMKMRMDIVDEQLDTVGQAFLGMTLGCARCHDHKFDPVTTADYYGLAGIFYSTKAMVNYKVVAVWNERPIDTPEAAAAAKAFEKALTAKKRDQTRAERSGLAAVAGNLAVARKIADLRKELEAFEKTRPAVAEAMAVEDQKGENLRIHLRGNHLTLGAEAPRRFLRVVAGDAPLPLGPEKSGRMEFAEWMTRPDHPLTARVIVNRLWAGHFGAGLVRSTDNFGRLGDRPSHPELLDWLAAELVTRNWSLKAMHRLLVTSAAYRMSTTADPATAQKDPDNLLLSHFNRRRLDAEEIRDGMLATGGLLDRKMGGQLLKATPRQYVNSTASRNYDGYSIPRRSVYLPVIRSGLYDVFQTLDFPDPSVPNGQRVATTIPTQSLLMMNSSLADQSAEGLAKAVLNGTGDRIDDVYRRVFYRPPTAAERERVSAYLKQSKESADSTLTSEARTLRAWRGLCRVLLASNEFVFVE